jgi:hypothetical protein
LDAGQRSFSQDLILLNSLPTTKEEFIKSEPAVINTVDWLENTPLNQETDKRKLLNANFLAWVTMPVTPTIITHADMTTVVTTINMSTYCCDATSSHCTKCS